MRLLHLVQDVSLRTSISKVFCCLFKLRCDIHSVIGGWSPLRKPTPPIWTSPPFAKTVFRSLPPCAAIFPSSTPAPLNTNHGTRRQGNTTYCFTLKLCTSLLRLVYSMKNGVAEMFSGSIVLRNNRLAIWLVIQITWHVFGWIIIVIIHIIKKNNVTSSTTVLCIKHE